MVEKQAFSFSNFTADNGLNICTSEFTQKAFVSCRVGKSKSSPYSISTYQGKIEAYFQIEISRACVNDFSRMRCHMKGKTMDIMAMILIFTKVCRKSPKNSLEMAICVCKCKFGSTSFYCSNSVMHELLALIYLSNERTEAYLSIHIHLIKQFCDYDRKILH